MFSISQWRRYCCLERQCNNTHLAFAARSEDTDSHAVYHCTHQGLTRVVPFYTERFLRRSRENEQSNYLYSRPHQDLSPHCHRYTIPYSHIILWELPIPLLL